MLGLISRSNSGSRFGDYYALRYREDGNKLNKAWNREAALKVLSSLTKKDSKKSSLSPTAPRKNPGKNKQPRKSLRGLDFLVPKVGVEPTRGANLSGF